MEMLPTAVRIRYSMLADKRLVQVPGLVAPELEHK
jgi:hypothetical protein